MQILKNFSRVGLFVVMALGVSAPRKKVCEVLNVKARVNAFLENTSALTNLGYSPAVAKRMLSDPRVLELLSDSLSGANNETEFNENVESLTAVDVYRGLEIDPGSLNYLYNKGVHQRAGAGKIYVSATIGFALRYAIGELSNRSKESGIILEMQVPRSWLDKHKDAEDNSLWWGYLSGMRAFIKRVGVVDTRPMHSREKIYAARTIHWLSFENFEKMYIR